MENLKSLSIVKNYCLTLGFIWSYNLGSFVFSLVIMLKKVFEPVSVSLLYDSKKNAVVPRTLIWKDRVYHVLKLGLHHKFRTGRVLYHVFSVSTETVYFKLVLDTENLHWKLEEISDGLPN